MLIPVPPSACMRAREAVSARLDGELSELDAVRLDAHLRACAECREYADQAALLTAELRAAPLEQPAVPTFVPARRRVRAKRMHGALAAAMVVLAAASAAVGRIYAGAEKPIPRAPAGVRSVPGDVSSPRRDGVEERVLAMLPASDRWVAELQSMQTPAL